MCHFLQKLIIDEKKYYMFGRNPDWCDFTIDHQSCSRGHAVLVYHKHLKRVFLIDLNSSKTPRSISHMRSFIPNVITQLFATLYFTDWKCIFFFFSLLTGNECICRKYRTFIRMKVITIHIIPNS